MIYSTAISLYLFSYCDEKNLCGIEKKEGSRSRVREERGTDKAESTIMGGVSIAQSHKHNKHVKELIILHEVFERFELVSVGILKLPVAQRFLLGIIFFFVVVRRFKKKKKKKFFQLKLKLVLPSVKDGLCNL